MKMINLGLTSIEALILGFVLVTLVLIAVPQIKNYLSRAQAIEGYDRAGAIKSELEAYYKSKGQFPANTGDGNKAIGVSLPRKLRGEYVSKVTVSDDGLGTITAEFGAGKHVGKFVRLSPIPVSNGTFHYSCKTNVELTLLVFLTISNCVR